MCVWDCHTLRDSYVKALNSCCFPIEIGETSFTVRVWLGPLPPKTESLPVSLSEPYTRTFENFPICLISYSKGGSGIMLFFVLLFFSFKMRSSFINPPLILVSFFLSLMVSTCLLGPRSNSDLSTWLSLLHLICLSCSVLLLL